MKVKPFTDKIKKFTNIGMPCTSKEFNDLKDGKEIALPRKVAELMQSMGLVQMLENKKTTKKEQK
tara:strand:+ start:252 stop:446 length:195 start_codon:yes stop_codon:yes gene_type:complete